MDLGASPDVCSNNWWNWEIFFVFFVAMTLRKGVYKTGFVFVFFFFHFPRFLLKQNFFLMKKQWIRKVMWSQLIMKKKKENLIMKILFSFFGCISSILLSSFRLSCLLAFMPLPIEINSRTENLFNWELLKKKKKIDQDEISFGIESGTSTTINHHRRRVQFKIQ